MDQEYNPDIYTLEDEEGNELVFELLDTMELEGQTYYAMMPHFENPEELLETDGELVVLKAEMVDGEEMMASIDDDEEYDRIGNIFLHRLAELFDAEGEDQEEE